MCDMTSLLRCVAVCCSVLQYVAVSCSLCDMTSLLRYVWIHVSWLIHMCSSLFYRALLQQRPIISFICVTWHLYWDQSEYMCYDSFICVAWLFIRVSLNTWSWLINVCGMTSSLVWHDSFMCVMWLIHICALWLIYMCDMAHLYV